MTKRRPPSATTAADDSTDALVRREQERDIGHKLDHEQDRQRAGNLGPQHGIDPAPAPKRTRIGRSGRKTA